MIFKKVKVCLFPLMLVFIGVSSSNAFAACNNWQDGSWYNVGDVVEYGGSNYVAVNENPGYNPSISTWFWDSTPETCGGGSSSGGWCASWIDGQWYGVGDVVEYNGQSYVAVNENPGYNPEISTWFWGSANGQCDGSGGGTGGGTSCPSWVDGQWYSVGEVVEYNGSYYVADNENPGYTPTVSTWFWSQISSCDGNPGGGNGGGSSGNGDDCGSQWYSARLTNYTSYPDPGSDECLNYNGCTWAGWFYGLDSQMSENWVSNNNIVAVHMKDWSWMGSKNINLRQGSNTISATVYDACSDSDCNGCCTANLGGDGFLIDVEKYTMWRFGSGSGTVEFQVCN